MIDDILARLGTTTRSRWFVIDLNPYVTVMNTVVENINHFLGVIRTVVENRAPGSNGLVNDFRGLSNELETLRETYFGVNARLAAYHALHPRNKRSLVPFIGQAFSFRFRFRFFIHQVLQQGKCLESGKHANISSQQH